MVLGRGSKAKTPDFNPSGGGGSDWGDMPQHTGDSGIRSGKKGLFGAKSKNRLNDEDGACHRVPAHRPARRVRPARQSRG